jgi:hypothetical protein
MLEIRIERHTPVEHEYKLFLFSVRDLYFGVPWWPKPLKVYLYVFILNWLHLMGSLFYSSSVKVRDVLTHIYLKLFQLIHAVRWFLTSYTFLLTSLMNFFQITQLLLNRKVHYRIYKNPPLGHFMCKLKVIHTLFSNSLRFVFSYLSIRDTVCLVSFLQLIHLKFCIHFSSHDLCKLQCSFK